MASRAISSAYRACTGRLKLPAGIRKRIRNICIGTELHTIKMPVRHRIRNLNKGDTVIVYLSEKTPVYEQENGYMVCSY